MNTQQALFDDFASTIDTWIGAIRAVVDDPNPDLSWTENTEAFECVRQAMRESEHSDALEQVVAEVVRGVIHSVLVTLDGGSKLAETTNLTIVDDSGEELPNNLHETFVSYLLETNRL